MNGVGFRRFFHLILGLTYVGLGVFMYIKNVVPVPPWGLILSLAFVLYGLFRIYRSTKIKA